MIYIYISVYFSSLYMYIYIYIYIYMYMLYIYNNLLIFRRIQEYLLIHCQTHKEYLHQSSSDT